MNNSIKNLKIRAKAFALSFILITTPLAITGCIRKPSKTSIEKSIEQSDLNTYMDSVYEINPEIKKDIDNLEKALANDPEDEKTKEYIINNSSYILSNFLSYFIKTTMCEANNESIYQAEDYIINFENDKQYGDRITLTKGTETYLIEDGLFKKIIIDYYNTLYLDEETDYEKIRNIAIDSIEDTKYFISKYDIERTTPSMMKSYFEPNINEVVKTKKRRK